LILFGFLPQSSKTKAMAAMLIVAHARAAGAPDTPGWLGDLDRFRQEFYGSLSARADALFELTDAVLCADGPVTSLVELTLLAEHRRGHGAMYDALHAGRVEPERLRRTVASLSLPTVGGRIVLAVDVSPWLRPDAPTSSDRLFCHVHGRARGNAQMIPGWRIRSWPPSKRAARRGPRWWTRSGSAPPTTRPR
jgi:DDE superfamily endonuclease